ncbi:inositol monophosphatase family protein [Mycolicibacterium rufum]|uniref:inositol monophosphatase family protein n=1 Tax=Mycolicibacterium rufum TaxID=318424 RepID=UPI000693F458|nr:inositol monophosphatase family protein [Mycolicibacterium rufum]
MCCDGRVSDIDTDLASVRAVAEQLAAEAAAFVRRRRTEVFDTAGSDQDGAIRAKSTPTDPVTVVDTETERLLRDRLADLRPGEPILGEEEGGPEGGDDGRLTWVLDPIDGTVNFVYGIEAFAVSVGVQRGGVSVAGAVADVAAGAVYSAARGHGARVTRDGQSTALRCSAATSLSMALVGTGFSYQPEDRRRQGTVMAALLPQIRDLRRIGSCALDLCMVAAGRLDAYYEDGVHVWDWAAGALIAAEAGAVVRAPGQRGPGLMVAAAPGLAPAFDEALQQCGLDLRR